MLKTTKRLKILVRLTVFVSIILFVTSCYYDKYDEVYPGNYQRIKCDSSGSYSKSVSRVFLVNCIGCHNKSVNNGGIILDNYNGAFYAARSGKLMQSVDGNPPIMPPGSNLDSCSIKALKNWIQLGAPNN